MDVQGSRTCRSPINRVAERVKMRPACTSSNPKNLFVLEQTHPPVLARLQKHLGRCDGSFNHGTDRGSNKNTGCLNRLARLSSFFRGTASVRTHLSAEKEADKASLSSAKRAGIIPFCMK